MTDKRILVFDGSTITALRWQSGVVTTAAQFSADALGHESFSAYLNSARNVYVYVLADVSEEAFQLETIPAVQGRDRDELIKRRLGQFFFGTPYSLGHSLGRQKEGRRDERVLFAALTRPEALTPWLELIQKSAVPLVGIYSVPLVLAENVKAMVSGQLQFLLVTMTTIGLRLTFFDDGKIQFSRLSQLGSNSQDEFAISCAREAARTYQYLLAQRLITDNLALQTIVVAHSIDYAKLRTQLEDTDKINFKVLDLDTVAKKAGLNTLLPDSHCDALLAHLLVTHLPKAQFAPEVDRKRYRLSQLRFGIGAATLAILFACLAVAGRTGLQWKDLQENTVLTNGLAALDSKRYEALLNELPKIKLTPDNLRAVIIRYQELMQHAIGPTPLLAHLSVALEAMPAVNLQSLEWTLGDRATGASAVANTSVLQTKTPAKVVTTLDVLARLPISMALDQRLQIETVNTLTTRLRTEAVHVSIIKSPVDVESGKALKRVASDNTRPSGPPEFTIRLTTTL